jgi:hypothetical protein
MKKVLVLLALSSCTSERVRVQTIQEGRFYDERPILHGPTKGHQRPGIPH